MLPTPVDERASNMLKQPNSKGLIMTFNRTLVTILATATLVPSIAFAAVSVGDTVGKTQEEIRSALEKHADIVLSSVALLPAHLGVSV